MGGGGWLGISRDGGVEGFLGAVCCFRFFWIFYFLFFCCFTLDLWQTTSASTGKQCLEHVNGKFKIQSFGRQYTGFLRLFKGSNMVRIIESNII